MNNNETRLTANHLEELAEDSQPERVWTRTCPPKWRGRLGMFNRGMRDELGEVELGKLSLAREIIGP